MACELDCGADDRNLWIVGAHSGAYNLQAIDLFHPKDIIDTVQLKD